MTISITELYDSLRWTDANALQGFRRFYLRGDANTPISQTNVWNEMITGPGGETSPVGGIPQLGETHPLQPKMIADNRVVEAVAPNALYIRIDYRRVSWGDIDTFYTGDIDNSIPPFVNFSSSISFQDQAIPVVIAHPVVGSNSSFIINYEVTTEPRQRFTTIVSATLHRREWTRLDDDRVAIATGEIHNELSSSEIKALFLGANVAHIGKDLYRVQYQWALQSSLPAKSELVVATVGSNNLTRLAVPEVDPHSNLRVQRVPNETYVPEGGSTNPPIFLQTNPISERPNGSALLLPGLEAADGLFT